MRKGSLSAVGILLTLTFMFTTSTASAAQYWNTFTTDLPAFVDAPTPFTVAVDGPDPVCAMSYAGQQASAAPWSFTFDPSSGEHQVDVSLCNGEQDYFYLDSRAPFKISDRVIFQSEQGRNDSVRVFNSLDVPAQAVLSDASGKVLASADVTPGGEAAIKVPLKGRKSSTDRLVVSAPGHSMSADVFVAKGWAPMDANLEGVFEPCSSLTWAYVSKGRAGKAKTIDKDIATGLRILSKRTGLSFTRVDDPASADIVYEWENMGSGGPAALGGYSWSSDSSASGTVTFNSKNFWVTDRYAGSGGGRPPGRAWLVVHETMHVLGFSHPDEKASIMNATNTGQHGFTPGDLAGLRAFYPKTACAN